MKSSNLFRGLNFQWRQDAVDVELVDGVSSNGFDPSGLGERLGWSMRERWHRAWRHGEDLLEYVKISVKIQRCQYIYIYTNYVREVS